MARTRFRRSLRLHFVSTQRAGVEGCVSSWPARLHLFTLIYAYLPITGKNLPSCRDESGLGREKIKVRQGIFLGYTAKVVTWVECRVSRDREYPYLSLDDLDPPTLKATEHRVNRTEFD